MTLENYFLNIDQSVQTFAPSDLQGLRFAVSPQTAELIIMPRFQNIRLALIGRTESLNSMILWLVRLNFLSFAQQWSEIHENK